MIGDTIGSNWLVRSRDLKAVGVVVATLVATGSSIAWLLAAGAYRLINIEKYNARGCWFLSLLDTWLVEEIWFKF